MHLHSRFGKWSFVLGTGLIFLVSFALSLLKRTTWCQPTPQALASDQEMKTSLGTGNLLEKSVLPPVTAEEKELSRGIEKSPGQEADRKILDYLLLMQGRPWQPNATAVAQYRTELGRCCNASFWLAITKENTPLGSDILLDGAKDKKLPVGAELVDLLPKKSPISGLPYDRCAVVGNGGILRNSSCGQEIDQADFIVRFNLPPMNYSKDVGTKTSLVTINPSILQLKFQNLEAHRKPFADALQLYRGALIFIPAFSFVGHTELAYRALYTVEDFGVGQQPYFLNPFYLDSLRTYWKDQGFHPRRLSSGFMLVSMALEFCKRITLYGFWPFSRDPAGRPIPHHYYDNTPPNPGIHVMNREFSHYLKMYVQSVLRLRLGKCQ